MSVATARVDALHQGAPSGFLGEEWLTPVQIARKSEYATDKPIRKAINSGELTAARPLCRRKRSLLADGLALRVVARGPLKTIENRRRVA